MGHGSMPLQLHSAYQVYKKRKKKKEPFQPSCPLFLPLSLSHTHVSVALYQKITAPPSAMYKKRMVVNGTDTMIFPTCFGSFALLVICQPSKVYIDSIFQRALFPNTWMSNSVTMMSISMHNFFYRTYNKPNIHCKKVKTHTSDLYCLKCNSDPNRLFQNVNYLCLWNAQVKKET